MNATQLEHQTSNSRRIANACLSSCRKLLAQTHRIKEAILNQFHGSLGEHDRLLRLALNEAEALARQTGFPHLLFPTLAMEKAESVRRWHARQQLLQQRGTIGSARTHHNRCHTVKA